MTARRVASALVVADERSCAAALATLRRALDVEDGIVAVATIPLRQPMIAAFAFS